jgi:hypothetical protein
MNLLKNMNGERIGVFMIGLTGTNFFAQSRSIGGRRKLGDGEKKAKGQVYDFIIKQ